MCDRDLSSVKKSKKMENLLRYGGISFSITFEDRLLNMVLDRWYKVRECWECTGNKLERTLCY